MGELREWSRNSTYSVKDMQSATGSTGLWRFRDGYWGNNPMDRACPGKKEAEIPPSSQERRVRGFCIEPMQATTDLLQMAFTRLGYFPAVTLIHAAVSSAPGKAQFPASAAGVESLGLGATDRIGGFVLVDVVTIDQLVAAHNISSIDVLSIDTEGNDLRVILGAVHTLAAQMVRLLEFEYHSIGRWAQSDLQDLIDLLDQFGFDCYWQGGVGWINNTQSLAGLVHNPGKLWRLTGCWDDSYYVLRGWSNVACANRNEGALIEAMHESALSIGAEWDIPPFQS